MDNSATVHVLESEANLDKPVEDLNLGESLILLLFSLNVISDIADCNKIKLV